MTAKTPTMDNILPEPLGSRLYFFCAIIANTEWKNE